jgi:hypothetical protein
MMLVECSSKNSWTTFRNLAFGILIRCLGSLKVFLHLVHLKRPSLSDQTLLFEHSWQIRFIPASFNITGTNFQTLPSHKYSIKPKLHIQKSDFACCFAMLASFGRYSALWHAKCFR